MLKISYMDEGTSERCSLVDFLDANRDDEDLCRMARDLKPGTRFDIGGGAAPHVRVEMA